MTIPEATPDRLPDPPAPGQAVAIRPGLLWVRMPLAGPPWHVNCWLLRDGAGWLVIDAGLDRPETRQAWEAILATHLDGLPVTRVLVTHFHADHVGLAGWLCECWGAPLLMARSEYLQARLLLREAPESLLAEQAALGEAAGAPADYLRHLLGRRPFYRPDVVDLPLRHRRIAAGQLLRVGETDWTLHRGGGHAPEMMLLHDAAQGVLIAADQVLPRISPYVGVFPPEPEADPLSDFLESNRRLLALPEGTLVLPSHGDPFFGLHDRIAVLAAHHAERLALLEEICATPRTAYEAARLMFQRDYDMDQMLFVIGEGLAHLNWLLARGRLVTAHGADDVVRYRVPG